MVLLSITATVAQIGSGEVCLQPLALCDFVEHRGHVGSHVNEEMLGAANEEVRPQGGYTPGTRGWTCGVQPSPLSHYIYSNIRCKK